MFWKAVIGVVTGPFARMGEAWVKARGDVELRRVERDMERDVITGDVRRAILDSEEMTQRLTSKIISEDRRNDKTSWIRPFTAKLSIAFWAFVCLTNLTWKGEYLTNMAISVPDGPIGVMMVGAVARVVAASRQSVGRRRADAARGMA